MRFISFPLAVTLTMTVTMVIHSVPALGVELFENVIVESSSLSHETLGRLEKLESKNLHSDFLVKRFSSKSLRFESIEQMERDYPSFEFEVENGQRLTARLTRILTQEIGFYSWVGRVEGDLHSTAIFTEKDGHLAGEVSAFGSNYSIKPLERELAALRKLDSSKATSTAEDVLFQDLPREQTRIATAAETTTSFDDSTENDGTVIDIYVFYTDAAAAASASVTTEIANDLAFTNTALDKSCTQTSLRLVGTSQLNFDESSREGDTYLNRLSSVKDGHYDSIHDTIRAAGADMVQLWVEESLGSSSNNASVGTVAGIAQAAVPHPGWGTTFSVKVRSTSAFTTAHEIGHNFSVWHDRFQCTGVELQTNYPVEGGFGYVNLNEKVRDIMSYGSECNAHSLTCSQLPYFSNPRIFVQGQPFGIPSQADAAFRIYKNRVHIARIRPASTIPTAPTFNGCMETQANSMKLDKCFIATAAFGSFLDPHVTTFRKFRDRTLAKTELGRLMIELYYEHSPSLVEWIESSPWVKTIARALLSAVLILILDPMAFAGIFGALILSMAIIALGRKRTRVRTLTSTYLPLLIGLLVCGQVPQAHASYNNSSLFSEARLRNPASFSSAQPQLSASLAIKIGSDIYSSLDQKSTESSYSASPVVELKYGSPNWVLWTAIEPQTKVTNKWYGSGDPEEWQSTQKTYLTAANLTLWQGLVAGLGFRKSTSSMIRPPSNPSGTWGVFETQNVQESMGGNFGMRWVAFEQLSLAGQLDLDQKVSSDTAKLDVYRGAVSVGYFGLADPFLHKFDLTYIMIPQSVAYEPAPVALGFQAQMTGVNIDTEVLIPFARLGIESILLGYEYEVLNGEGHDSNGSRILHATQRIKFGTKFWEKTAELSGYTQSKTIESGTMTETAEELALAFSMVF